MIILLSLFTFLTLIVDAEKRLKFFVSNLIYLIVLFAFSVALLGLLDLLDIVSYNDFSQIGKINGSPFNESVYIDWNFATIPSFFGIIGVFYLFQKNNSRLQILLFKIFLIIFTLNIIFSGSRRGMFLLIIILAILIIIKIVLIFREKFYLRKINSVSNFLIYPVISIIITLSLFFLFTGYRFKNKTLQILGTKNIGIVKPEISMKLYRYVSVIVKNVSFYDFHGRLWSVEFDPKNPDSGWGTRNHKNLYPLAGQNVEIVPKGVTGYLMDSTCNPSYYDKINICESFTLVASLKGNPGDKYNASVYCFISDSFKIDMAALSVSAANIGKQEAIGNVTSTYNFAKMGTWQKLGIDFACNGGDIQIYMSFLKNGVKDFSKLKGYIVFAYPQFEKKSTDTGLLFNYLTTKSTYECKIVNLKKNILEFDNNSVKQNQIRTYSNNKIKYFYSGFFCFPVAILNKFSLPQNDTDPIRKLAVKIISEDTTYHPYKTKIVLGTFSNALAGDRLLRWEFAINIYMKEFDLKQKVFGGGFNFLNWYGFYFDKDKTRSDYPHNPFLSVLLYSGIIGLLIYVFFMYKVFYYYFKYFKEYKILAIFFLITFFFSFFSAGSPFDPPIMGFFVILPFFIHSVHKKDKSGISDIKVNEKHS
jgi:hypothetical protein